MAQPFDIPEDLFKRAEAAAESAGISIRQFILEAILEAVEDSEDTKAADEVMRRIEAGEEKLYTLDELGEFLELDDCDRGLGGSPDRKAS